MKKITMLLALAIGTFGCANAQKSVSGTVLDANGAPVQNASITVKGTAFGTSSDEAGSFTLSVPANRSVLVISVVGMVEQEVTIPSSGPVTVILQSSSTSLDEVVVVGYGTQRRRDVTGNIASVRGAVVADKPVQTFDQALAGRAAGVQISVANGVLNSPPVFRIRGTNSISLSSYPLVVIDGVPAFTGDVSSTAAASNPLASLNPADIESIDVAKDASATAIYGSRAANGVVFVTTKKGKSGKLRVNYNGWVSSSSPYRLPDLLNGSEYISFKTAAVANNPTSTVKYNWAQDANGQNIDTKWSDYVYRKGLSHSHNVNLSGGGENASYYFSTGYTDQQGILKRNNFKRINTMLNVDGRLSNAIVLGGKVSYSNEMNLAATSSGSLSGSAFNTAGLGRLSFVLPPILSPYMNDGSYNNNGAAIGSANITGISNLGYFNPAVALDKNRSNSESNRFRGNVYLQIKPWKWLTLKTVYGMDYLLVDNDIFWSPIGGDGYSYKGFAADNLAKYKTTLWTNTAQLDYTISKLHHIDFLVGNEQQRTTSSGYGLQRQGLSDPEAEVIQAGFTTNNPTNLLLGENYLLSSFGRLNYNLNNKYYLSGNIRQDEYSALAVKKGIFWGFSGGWEVAKEQFWSTLGADKLFSSFKLRGSFGKVGNVGGIGDFTSFSLFSPGLYGGLPTSQFSQVGNPTLTWETSKKLDMGLNFGLLDNRITGDITYYRNNIDGLILFVAQAPSSGLPNNPPLNIGSMYNRGWEFSLNAEIIRKTEFSWSTMANFSINKNRVTALAPGMDKIETSTSGLETVNRTMVGYPIGQLFVVRTAGVDPATGKRIFLNSKGTPVYYQYYAASGTFNWATNPEGTTKYVSPTGASAISQGADGVMYANTSPKYYGGWDNNFRYKGFELNIMTTFQLGFNVYYGSNAGLHDQRWWNNASDVLTDAWTKSGDAGKKYAKPVYGDNVSNGSTMPLDMNVFKGDFAKLKNITLGYTIPKTISQKARINNLRVYVSGQNLAILTGYPGPDPEVSSNGNSTTAPGVDRNTAANARTILFGINLGL